MRLASIETRKEISTCSLLLGLDFRLFESLKLFDLGLEIQFLCVEMKCSWVRDLSIKVIRVTGLVVLFNVS